MLTPPMGFGGINGGKVPLGEALMYVNNQEVALTPAVESHGFKDSVSVTTSGVADDANNGERELNLPTEVINV